MSTERVIGNFRAFISDESTDAVSWTVTVEEFDSEYYPNYDFYITLNGDTIRVYDIDEAKAIASALLDYSNAIETAKKLISKNEEQI